MNFFESAQVKPRQLAHLMASLCFSSTTAGLSAFIGSVFCLPLLHVPHVESVSHPQDRGRHL